MVVVSSSCVAPNQVSVNWCASVSGLIDRLIDALSTAAVRGALWYSESRRFSTTELDHHLKLIPVVCSRMTSLFFQNCCDLGSKFAFKLRSWGPSGERADGFLSTVFQDDSGGRTVLPEALPLRSIYPPHSNAHNSLDDCMLGLNVRPSST